MSQSNSMSPAIRAWTIGPQKAVINLLMVGISCVIGLLLCEVGSRLFLNPVDYLSVDVVEHNILGIALPAHTGGYDEWGFRNSKVPSTVEIVAIGDSHTFGNTAKMVESWPSVLGRLTGKTVYNLGLGGYGPNQYYYLFKTKALGLKPQIIICGLYMGDDFDNAFRITYGLDYWSFLRTLPFETANADIWEAPETSSWHKRIRAWLSGHSVIYRIVFHGPLVGKFKGNVQIENASRLYDSATALILKEQNIAEAFVPKGVLRGLDQEKRNVKEGMRITLKLLKEMNDTSLQSNVQFIVAVIPTKEMVFSDYLQDNRQLKLADVIHALIANERRAREELFRFFGEAKVRHVDVLPWLKRSVGREIYARSAGDMHPNKNGYEVIAEAISASLVDEDKKH